MKNSKSEENIEAMPAPIPKSFWCLIAAVTLITWSGFVAFVYVYAYYGGSWVDSLSNKVGEVVLTRARQLAEVGDPEEAIVTYRQALSVSFDNPRHRVIAHHELCRLLLQLDRPMEAAEVMEKALALDPDDGWNYGLLALALRKANQPEKLLHMTSKWTEFADSIGHEYHIGHARFNRGLALLQLGRQSAALEAFKAAHDLAPFPGNALKAAETLHKLHRGDEAIPYLEFVLDNGEPTQAKNARTLLNAIQDTSIED